MEIWILSLSVQDDPLSALDAHVGKHVFEDAIVKRLVRRKRSVILVTHQLQYVGHSNQVSTCYLILSSTRICLFKAQL